MNIEKLKELSKLRLSNNESYQNLKNKQKQVEEIKHTISSIEEQINQLILNATYENDHFDLIDKLKIKKEELERASQNIGKEKYKVDPYDGFYDAWDLGLDEYIEYIEIMGIVDLIKDPNFTEILKEHAENIGILELKDALFIPKFISMVKTSNIDVEILGEYTSTYDSEYITKYISRLLFIAKLAPVDNHYHQLNEKFLDICKEFESFGVPTSPSIFDAACEAYGEELGKQFLQSLVEDELYRQVSPKYTITCLVTDPSFLMETENGVKRLKSSKKIYAGLIKMFNSTSDEDEPTISLSDFVEEDNDLIYDNMDWANLTAEQLNVSDDEISAILEQPKKM